MNPLLGILASIIRHLLVTGLGIVVAFFNVPDDMKDKIAEAADFSTASIIMLITWLISKYGRALAVKIGVLNIVVFFTAGLGALSMTSCTASVNPLTGEVTFGIDPAKAAEAAKRGNALAQEKLDGIELPKLPPVPVEPTK